ncbi:hypothetical protein RA28_02845 [Ruegeria sp. ANG-S4]|nr:hypothetical protein RA28_02845 [Ruegeria sp. ANG-S4]
MVDEIQRLNVLGRTHHTCTALACWPRCPVDWNAGPSTIRAVIDGLSLASVVLLTIGLKSDQTPSYLAVATLMGVVEFGRTSVFSSTGSKTRFCHRSR